MAKQRKDRFLFRGTTLGWPGNKAMQTLPRTSASIKPLKALLFAMSAKLKGSQVVIYIAKREKIKTFLRPCWVCHESENSIVL
ncbi:MAG: hypothetical protein M3342_24670 [Bacteroidota bacterium]|nr:hypothetical protein [Bacteroidota bacterium]